MKFKLRSKELVKQRSSRTIGAAPISTPPSSPQIPPAPGRGTPARDGGFRIRRRATDSDRRGRVLDPLGRGSGGRERVRSAQGRRSAAWLRRSAGKRVVAGADPALRGAARRATRPGGTAARPWLSRKAPESPVRGASPAEGVFSSTSPCLPGS